MDSEQRVSRNNNPDDSVVLSRLDVQSLLENPTEEVKVEVISKVSAQYDPENLSSEEMNLADQIFHILVYDSALQIRSALAESLKNNPHISKDIIKTLAHDEGVVSVPVLRASEVLSEQDLLEIVQHSGEIYKLVAIASRPDVTENISDALVAADHDDVTSELLDNQKAEISEDSYEAIIERSEDNENIISKIVERKTLPVTVAEKLSRCVSEEVARRIHSRFDLSGSDIEKERRKIHEQNILDLLIAFSEDDKATTELVDQLYREDRLTSSLIINALCHGNILFLEKSFSKLSGVPLENTRLLVADRGEFGFRAIYKKSGLPMLVFDSVRFLLDSVRDSIEDGFKPDSAAFSNEVAQRIVIKTEGKKVDNISYVLALLKQQNNRPAS